MDRNALEGVLDFITETYASSYRRFVGFLQPALKPLLLITIRSTILDLAKKNREEEGERLPLNLERRIFTWAVGG